MSSPFYDNIKKYFIEGYGIPIKHYTTENLNNFVKAKIITEEEKNQIINEKS